jgi:hypothetical protein
MMLVEHLLIGQSFSKKGLREKLLSTSMFAKAEFEDSAFRTRKAWNQLMIPESKR